MATVPAVRVTLEDRSYVAESVNEGRSVLIVVLSDRGPHNQIVPINSIEKFIDTFGKPNIERNGQAHYFATKALSRTNQLFVIRPALIDSSIPSNNCSIANSIITHISPTGAEKLVQGRFVFTNETDAITAFGEPTVSQYVFTDYIGFTELEIGSKISTRSDGLIEALSIIEKQKINGIGSDTSNFLYRLKLSGNYKGNSTVDIENANALLVSLITGGDPLLISDYTGNVYNRHTLNAIEYISGAALVPTHTYSFVNGSNIVKTVDEDAFNAINYEEWIYPESDSHERARQVAQKFITNEGEYQLVLNAPYTGNTIVNTLVNKYRPILISSAQFIRKESDFDTNSDSNLVYIYGKGAGGYYNNIYLRATRNTRLEKMYVDANGEPIYKYAFFDLSVYSTNPDGTQTVLEGPWTCSLMNTVNGVPVRDIFTGRELYFVKTINTFSRYLTAKEGKNAAIWEGIGDNADLLRLQTLSLFAESYVTDTNTRGLEGFYLDNGSDGIHYDQWNRLNIDHPEIQSIVRSAYSGTLKSIDGSIELLKHTIYPWYEIDYISAGGYSNYIQSGAKEMTDTRWDCLLIGDTGYNASTAQEDVNTRINDIPWNTPNVMLYSQYREIRDPFTGKPIMISPAYHALDNHLRIDNDLFLGQPVAGISKAYIQDSIKLAYKPSLIDMDQLINNEINPVITEPDGSYILTQFTTYKAHSILKRGHAIKFIHFVRKRIPGLLKDILQQNGSNYWVGVAESRVKTFLEPYSKEDSIRQVITNSSVKVQFNEERAELDVYLTLKVIRAIENINVYIVVT